MEILRKLRWFLYPSVFVLVFLFGAYCSFPVVVLRTIAEGSITGAALGMGPENRGMPTVVIKDLSLWRASGISIEGLNVSWPGTKKGSAMDLVIDSFKTRLGIFSLLMGAKNIEAQGELYKGFFEAQVKIAKPNNLSALSANISRVDLATMAFIESLLGSPLKGQFDLVADINANSQLSKDGTGTIKITIDKGVFGPGSINLPSGGFVSSLAVPLVSLGKLTIELNLDKGQLDSKHFTLTGGDLEAELNLNIGLAKVPQSSRLSGTGWFSLKREFLNSNETIKMLFDLLPELRAAQQGNGKVSFSLYGSLGRPQFKLDSGTGQKKASKNNKVADAEDFADLED